MIQHFESERYLLLLPLILSQSLFCAVTNMCSFQAKQTHRKMRKQYQTKPESIYLLKMICNGQFLNNYVSVECLFLWVKMTQNDGAGHILSLRDVGC